ncbi:hypothetical protein C8Q73DRAFT_795886 [Cubamyces lactineus]|nr:hypothetical protein C8Q73DRAFT_795886 [Cubamyces lactineus]
MSSNQQHRSPRGRRHSSPPLPPPLPYGTPGGEDVMEQDPGHSLVADAPQLPPSYFAGPQPLPMSERPTRYDQPPPPGYNSYPGQGVHPQRQAALPHAAYFGQGSSTQTAHFPQLPTVPAGSSMPLGMPPLMPIPGIPNLMWEEIPDYPLLVAHREGCACCMDFLRHYAAATNEMSFRDALTRVQTDLQRRFWAHFEQHARSSGGGERERELEREHERDVGRIRELQRAVREYEELERANARLREERDWLQDELRDVRSDNERLRGERNRIRETLQNLYRERNQPRGPYQTPSSNPDHRHRDPREPEAAISQSKGKQPVGRDDFDNLSELSSDSDGNPVDRDKIQKAIIRSLVGQSPNIDEWELDDHIQGEFQYLYAS